MCRRSKSTIPRLGAMNDARPTLVFDGDCGFCTTSVNQLRRLVHPDCVIIEWQRADLSSLGLTAEECREAVQWVIPGVTHASGGAAIAEALTTGRTPWPILGNVLKTEPLRRPTEAIYRLIAKNRYKLPGGTPACALQPAPGADSIDKHPLCQPQVRQRSCSDL